MIQRYAQFLFFRKGSGNSYSNPFWVWFFKKTFSHLKPASHLWSKSWSKSRCRSNRMWMYVKQVNQERCKHINFYIYIYFASSLVHTALLPHYFLGVKLESNARNIYMTKRNLRKRNFQDCRQRGITSWMNLGIILELKRNSLKLSRCSIKSCS